MSDETTTTTPSPQYTTKRLVCLGMRVYKDTKRAQHWAEVLDGNEIGEGHVYTPNLIASAPGLIYEVKFNEAGNAVAKGPNAPVYEGLYPDENLRAQWKLAHDTAETYLRKVARQRKDAEDNALTNLLEPIRELYHNTNYQERKALLAVVMEYITR